MNSRMNVSRLIAEVDALLSESATSVRQREETAFDDAVGTRGRSLVLFGAGNLGRKTLAGLRQCGIEPLAFADNNPKLWHTQIEGLNVLSLPEAARQYGRSAAFVCTIWGAGHAETMGNHIDRLHAAGCEVATPFSTLFWKFPDVFLPHYSLDLPHKVLESAGEIRRACRIWADDASRNEFLAQLRWRTHLDIDGLPRPVAHEQYFPDDLFQLTPDEAFVDCGAYDGDTIKALVRQRGASFGPIESFEPDPDNLRKLNYAVSLLPAHIRAKVRVHPCAVGSRTQTLRFNAEGKASSSVGEGTLEVNCVDLDHYLSDRKPTFIKMDIEGFEPEALAGATRTIRRHVPILAICCYHLQDHLWRLPLLMRSLSEEYRLFLRPHDLAAWDLVCYAVPLRRLGALPAQLDA